MDKQRSTKHKHKDRDRTRTPLKTRGRFRCSGREKKASIKRLHIILLHLSDKYDNKNAVVCCYLLWNQAQKSE